MFNFGVDKPDRDFPKQGKHWSFVWLLWIRVNFWFKETAEMLNIYETESLCSGVAEIQSEDPRADCWITLWCLVFFFCATGGGQGQYKIIYCLGGNNAKCRFPQNLPRPKRNLQSPALESSCKLLRSVCLDELKLEWMLPLAVKGDNDPLCSGFAH